MTDDDEKDELWQLLGKARPPVVSPFFSRDVVRASRQMRQGAGLAEFGQWLLQYWQIPALAACAIAIAGGAAWQRQPVAPAHEQEQEQLLAMAESVSRSPDFSVIGNLDELLDSERNSVWLSADY